MLGASNSISRRQVRTFGAVAFVLFGSACVAMRWFAPHKHPYFFAALAVFGFLCALVPGPMTPIYKGWIKIGQGIGKVLSTLMLILFFYLFLTPYAFILKLFKGGPLPLKPDKDATTYWLPRPLAAQTKEQFFKRY
jgi:hypothetical protein